MFKQILYTQWKWSAWAVVLATIAAFAVPVITVQRAGVIDPTTYDVVQMLGQMRDLGVLYPLLALAAGLTLALTSWAADHKGNHVYALTLPIPRWYYALLRLGAGAVLLAPAAVALWVGALLATAQSRVPQGLSTYPNSIALRFLLVVLVTYAAMFALASGTSKTLRTVAGAFVAVVGIQVAIAMLGFDLDFLGPVLNAIFLWPGPFELLFGEWMLINV